MNDLFDKASKAVANKYGFDLWEDLLWHCENGYAAPGGIKLPHMSIINQQIFEHGCNDAVKADRNTIRNTCLYSMPKLDKSGETEGYYWIFDGQKFQELELPFPQKTEQI